MNRGADISEDGLYRYLLWREWDGSKDRMVWIMLNPSTADAETDDVTITKCIGFAQHAGCGGIQVINLYALRATQPEDLYHQWYGRNVDPEGPRNVEMWSTVLSDPRRGLIVAAWGDSAPKRLPASVAYREHFIRPDVPPAALCLGKTAKGTPRHPSRLGYDTPMVAL